MDSGIRPRLQHSEESFCVLDIAPDLRAQKVSGVEAAFLSNALKKLKPRACHIWSNRRVQYERFDCLRSSVERWTSTDVGDGFDKSTGIHGCARNVDTWAGNKLII